MKTKALYPILWKPLLLLLTAAFPILAHAEETIIASGTCGVDDGDNLTWTVDSDGWLIISGSGAMEDYTHNYYGTSAPWNDCCLYVTALKLPNGLTHIGDNAFYGWQHLLSHLT